MRGAALAGSIDKYWPLPKLPPFHLVGLKPCSQMEAVAAGEVPWK